MSSLQHPTSDLMFGRREEQGSRYCGKRTNVVADSKPQVWHNRVDGDQSVYKDHAGKSVQSISHEPQYFEERHHQSHEISMQPTDLNSIRIGKRHTDLQGQGDGFRLMLYDSSSHQLSPLTRPYQIVDQGPSPWQHYPVNILTTPSSFSSMGSESVTSMNAPDMFSGSRSRSTDTASHMTGSSSQVYELSETEYERPPPSVYYEAVQRLQQKSRESGEEARISFPEDLAIYSRGLSSHTYPPSAASRCYCTCSEHNSDETISRSVPNHAREEHSYRNPPLSVMYAPSTPGNPTNFCVQWGTSHHQELSASPYESVAQCSRNLTRALSRSISEQIIDQDGGSIDSETMSSPSFISHKLDDSPLDSHTSSVQLPATMLDQDKKDDFLVKAKQAGMSYKNIRTQGKFKEAESTLRGRFRNLTKAKHERVRKPKWSDRDLALLTRAVAEYSPEGRKAFERTSHNRGRIPWKKIAEYIATHGSYRFGNATCRKKWEEINHRR